MEITPHIEQTDDGSPTLRHPVYADTYHSTRGAVGESLHVFIDNGLVRVANSVRVAADNHIVILEMGFGSGLNAWLTLDYARQHDLNFEYHAVEAYPVNVAVAAQLDYTDDPLFGALHRAPWNVQTQITPQFTLRKYHTHLEEAEFLAIFDLVYFDAFAPDTQPELWSRDVFRKIYDRMTRGALLTTYSAKGDVKRALRDAGFSVTRTQGALGKRHMLVAVKE